MQVSSVHQHWSSRFAFIMATVGAAVGLGNFWRFPYQAGENGGGAFVIIYIGVILVVAVPLVMSELLIGRRGQRSAVGSAADVGRQEGGSGVWGIIGWLGMLSSFVVVSYYSVIAGWVMAYIPKAIMPGAFDGGVEVVGGHFNSLISSPLQSIGWHTLFLVITCFIVIRGLHNGIERAATILMPAFFVMLLFVVYLASSNGDFSATVDFLFKPRWAEVNVSVVMAAVSQAFFSIGVATAILITYGAYLNRDAHLPRSSFVISFADTGVALLAGFAVFPLVFALNLPADSGFDLLFKTLPHAIAASSFAQLFGTTFFVLAFFAALTSSIALLEIIISWAEEKGFTRVKAVIFFGGLVWIVGVFQALSFNSMGSSMDALFGPDVLPGVGSRNVFGFTDFVATKVFMPLGGVLIAVLVGWVVSRETAQSELQLPIWAFKLWRFLVRFLIPIAVGGLLILSTAQDGFGVDLLAMVGLNGG